MGPVCQNEKIKDDVMSCGIRHMEAPEMKLLSAVALLNMWAIIRHDISVLINTFPEHYYCTSMYNYRLSILNL